LTTTIRTRKTKKPISMNDDNDNSLHDDQQEHGSGQQQQTNNQPDNKKSRVITVNSKYNYMLGIIFKYINIIV